MTASLQRVSHTLASLSVLSPTLSTSPFLHCQQFPLAVLRAFMPPDSQLKGCSALCLFPFLPFLRSDLTLSSRPLTSHNLLLLFLTLEAVGVLCF